MSSTIATINALFLEIGRVLDGELPDTSSLALGSMLRFLRVAEKRIYREARCRFNEKDFSGVTTTSNLATIPADYKAPSVVHVGKKPLEPVASNWLREYLDNGATGDCRYYAEEGVALRFGPALANATVVQGRYFYELPALTDATIATNALFQEADDLFIYATLVEMAPHWNKPDMLPVWEAKYVSVRDALNGQSARAAFSSGRIVRRPSTALMR